MTKTIIIKANFSVIISATWYAQLSKKDAHSLKEIQKNRLLLLKQNCLKGLNDRKGEPLSGVVKINY